MFFSNKLNGFYRLAKISEILFIKILYLSLKAFMILNSLYGFYFAPYKEFKVIQYKMSKNYLIILLIHATILQLQSSMLIEDCF